MSKQLETKKVGNPDDLIVEAVEKKPEPKKLLVEALSKCEKPGSLKDFLNFMSFTDAPRRVYRTTFPY